MSMSDRIAVMNEGRIEQVGPPEELYREPASQFVAEFIGDTNLFDGEVVERDGRPVVEVGGEDGPTAPADGRSGPATVSIRPEDFDVANGSRDGTGTLPGEVEERYFQGDRTNYVVDPDADVEPVQVVVQGRDDAVDTGERVTLQVDERAPVVF